MAKTNGRNGAPAAASVSFTVPGMDRGDAEQVIAGLSERLLALIDLELTLKHIHWNVVGPHFIAVHEMLDGFRKDLDGHVDTIAERAVQLGGTALGTSQVVAADSKLAAYPTDIYTTKNHLAALIDRFADTAKAARAAIDEADEAGDADTADILPPIRARSTSRFGSWKRTYRKRNRRQPTLSDFAAAPAGTPASAVITSAAASAAMTAGRLSFTALPPMGEISCRNDLSSPPAVLRYQLRNVAFFVSDPIMPT